MLAEGWAIKLLRGVAGISDIPSSSRIVIYIYQAQCLWRAELLHSVQRFDYALTSSLCKALAATPLFQYH